MDIFRLELEQTNFSDQSLARWRIRRNFIGLLLFVYYLYAFVFFFMVAFPGEGIFAIDLRDSQVQIQEVQPSSPQIPASPTDKEPVTVNKAIRGSIPPLLLMVTFGFIGGVFSISQTFVRTAQKFVDGKPQRIDLPVAWYLTRPLQSALMAIFIYYAFRAGQLVFYSMEGAPDEKQINVFTLSLLAIIAGAFSEQAFEKLYSVAENILKVKTSEKSN
ncbi:MAG TPA: hypothetical protein VLS47_03005 [Gallionella sp.]|nr:hypothetical protein [Gallionella sp.]